MAQLLTLREDAEVIAQIQDDAAEKLKERYDVDVLESKYIIATAAYSYFAAMVERLNKYKNQEGPVHLDFGGLFKIGISYQEEEEAEKEGNFTPFMYPGELFESLVKGETSEILMNFAGETVDFGESQETFNAISDFAVKHLKREFNIPMDGKTVALSAIIFQFFASLMEQLMLNKPESEGTVEVNFAQLFDIGIQVTEDGTVIPFFRAGQEFKLLIKDDNRTE